MPEKQVSSDEIGSPGHECLCIFQRDAGVRNTGNREETQIMKKTLTVLGAALALLAGCGSSEDPALVARIKSMSEQKSRTMQASGQIAAPAYRAGQYVTMVTIEGKKRSITQTGIVGQRDGGWVIEFSSITPSEETVSQICFAGLEKLAQGAGTDALEIKWIKIKDADGKVSVMSRENNPFFGMMTGSYKDMAAGMQFKAVTTYEQGGTVSVPAGVFNGTLKVNSTVTVMGNEYKAVNWMHSGVPINALVRSVADDTVLELVDYGYDYKAKLD